MVISQLLSQPCVSCRSVPLHPFHSHLLDATFPDAEPDRQILQWWHMLHSDGSFSSLQRMSSRLNKFYWNFLYFWQFNSINCCRCISYDCTTSYYCNLISLLHRGIKDFFHFLWFYSVKCILTVHFMYFPADTVLKPFSFTLGREKRNRGFCI